MATLDFISFSETTLLRELMSSDWRPNVLIVCDGVPVDTVVHQLLAADAAGCYTCRLPGALDLPFGGRGTLILHDVSRLTIDQQIALSDWISYAKGDMRIVSISQVPLHEAVNEGLFLEGLFYRLNTVMVQAKNGYGRLR